MSDQSDSGPQESTGEPELPADVADEAERLTRLAREAIDENEAEAYRRKREALLSEYGFTARVREADNDVLVVHPAEWVEDGTVHPSRIEDVDRGIERPLEGPGEADDWDAVDDHNRTLAAAVADEHGSIHGENARALATFLSNHYAKPAEKATSEELYEFLTEYFPRNAWPSEKQKETVRESVRLVYNYAESECPLDGEQPD